MPDLNWGMLSKSQIDPETIEEAIARIIAEHNADEEAHLSAGQSLQSHKASEIIDHVVGSVLADKNTMTEVFFRTFFENITGWAVVGTVENDDFPGVRLYAEWGVVDDSHISCTPQIPANFRDSSKNIMFQIVAHFSFSSTHFNAWLGFLGGYVSGSDGFGFTITDGVLKAHVRCGTTTVLSSALSFTLSDDHVYRAQYDATSGNVYFYIDGSLVATLAKPAGSWADDEGPGLGIILTEENDGNFRALDLFASREV